MRIAVSSQNFREVTGHAGQARRFIVYDVDATARVTEAGRLDLPADMAMHGFDGPRPHPLDGMDVLITAGAGEGFIDGLARRGVRVLTTSEKDPETAVHAFLAGCLKAPRQHGPRPPSGGEGCG